MTDRPTLEDLDAEPEPAQAPAMAIREGTTKPAPVEATGPERCCGKPVGAVCVHDLIQPAEPLPARLCICPCHGEVAR